MREIKQLQELAVWFSDSSEELPKRLVYVYYCEICNSILALRSKFEYRQTLLNSADARCRSCHFSLDAAVRCRVFRLRIPTSILPRERVQSPSSHNGTPRNSFSTLESLLNAEKTMSNICYTPSRSSGIEEVSLKFDIKEIDEMCGGLNKRQFAVLYGSKVCQAVVERLCVRSQLPVDEGGLGAASVFIDGGNTFDVYHVSECATSLYLDRDEALRKIQVSRAFTCYRLVNLIIDKLPNLLTSQQNIGFVAISNILDLFLDSEIDEKEAKHTINFLSNFLTQLAREKRVALIVTCPSQRKRSDAALRQFLTSRANIVLRAEQRDREMKFTLEKHPTKRVATRIVSRPLEKGL